MPYTSREDCPPNVRKLPVHLQEVWLATFNNAWREHAGEKDQEATAFAIAWAAVNKARKKWVDNERSRQSSRPQVVFSADMIPKIDGKETYATIQIFDTNPTERQQFDFHNGPIRFTPNALKLLAESGRKTVLRGPKGPLSLGHDLNYHIGANPEVFLSPDALSIMFHVTDNDAAEKIRSGEWRDVSGKIFFDNNSIEIDGTGCAVINEAWLDTVDFVDAGAFPCAAVRNVCDTPEQCRLPTALFQAIYPSHPEGVNPEGMTDVAASLPTTQPQAAEGTQAAEKNRTPTELAIESCRQEAFSLREKYNISAEKSRKSQFLYTPTDTFSDWKFPVRDNSGKLQKDLVDAAIKRLHMTSAAIQVIIRPKLKRLAKEVGIDASSLEASLSNKEETKMTDNEQDKIAIEELTKAKITISAYEKNVAELKAASDKTRIDSEKKIADLEATNKKIAEDLHAIKEQGAIGLQMRHDLLFDEKRVLEEKLGETHKRAQSIEMSFKKHLAQDVFDKRVIAGTEDPAKRSIKVEELSKLPYQDLDALMLDAEKTIVVFERNGILGDTYGTGAAPSEKQNQSKPAFTIGSLVDKK